MKNFILHKAKTGLLFLLFGLIGQSGWGQVWTYDFGTGTGSHTSSTASTSFLPTPTSGTSRVRVGTNPGLIALVNPGIAIGTGSELQITSNTGSSSTTKFSVYDYSASKSGYMKFTIAFNGGTNGVYQFAIGDGASFSDNNPVATAQIFTGIQWTFGASNSITYRVLNNATYGTTGITNFTTLFSQSINNSYIVEAYFNNETASINYGRSGSSYSIASGTWDLWIGGTLIGNDIARGGMSNNVNIDSWAFNHQSSSTSPGTIYIDEIEYSNILATPPVVTNTTPATNIASTSATLAGNVTATGGASISANGSVYSLTATNAAPQIGGTGVTQLATSSPGSGTGAFSNNISATLAVNTQYSFNAYATNSVGTSYGTVSTFYTLANVPSAPTVNNATTTSLDVAINANSNPSTTEFAIQETGGNYVQANGTLGVSAVWQAAAAWGTKTVTGLTANTSYTFQVKARNGANSETAFGSTAALSTLAGASPVANITGPLSEQSLNGGTLQVSLTNETFSTTPVLGDFTLNNAPSNLTIGSVTYNSSTSVTLNLVYSGDFDSNITTFSVTIASSVLTSATALTTNNITLTALVESLSVGTVTGFGNQTVNTTSTEKSFTISGTVRSTVSVAPPSGYEISLGTAGSFVATNPISLTPSGTSIASTTIYVRFKPTAISAYNGNITASATAVSSATVALTGSGVSPSNPSTFTATTASNSQINLAATGNSNSNNIVVVYNATGTFSSPSDGVAAGAQGAAFAGGTIWYNGAAASLTNHTGLNAATPYYYKAFSYDALNFYSLGSTANATTVKAEPSAQATSFVFNTITTSSFNTAFTAASGTPDGYLVIRSLSSSLSANPADGTAYTTSSTIGGGSVVSVGTTITGIANSSLSSGTTYYTFVFAYNNSGATIDYLTTNPLTASTITLSGAPAPTASNVTALSFDLSWSAVTGATSYQLDVTTDAGFTAFVSGYTNLNVSGTSQSVSGLLSNTTYYFRVRAVNASGNSAYGSGNQLTTLLSAPVATAASNVGATSFTANWGAVTGASSGYLLDVSTSATFGTTTNATDLFISEYVEGSSNNKYIEIYNGTGASVDLSNYKLQMYTNGSATVSSNISLSGNLTNGSTIVYKNTSALLYLGAATTNAAVGFNGNDAIALYKVSTASYVDIIGRIGTDPGASWTSGSTLSTLDKTLVRKSSVTSGITTNPATDFTTLATEWDVYNIDTVSNLGAHTFISFTPSFVSGYNPQPISGQATIAYSVTGLSEATTYYYRVRATDGTASANSNVITVTTKKTPTVSPVIGSYTYNGSAQGPNSIATLTPTPTSVTYSYVGVNPTSYGPSSTRPTNAGSYTVTATVEADANYVSASSSATAFTIAKASSSITVTGSTSFIYSGSAQGPATSTVTGSSGSVSYSYSGVSPTVYVTSATAPTNVGSYTVTATVAADANYEAASSTATAFGIVYPTNNWTGANSTSWNNPGNWSLSRVPLSTDNITISTGTPVLDVSHTIGAGRTLTISGTGTLTINPNAILTIAGTADFGDKSVIIKSDASGDGAIGQVTGTLSNATSVTVERYIPAKRAWRALTAPLKGSANNSIFYNWQNNGSVFSGVGVELWGPAGTGSDGNGLASGPGASIKQYGNGWTDVTDSKTTSLFTSDANNAYMVFVTGGYGSNNITNGGSAPTTLKATGQLRTGDVTYTGLSSTFHTLIGNPYASPISPSSILNGATNLFTNVWVWDPKLSDFGAYVNFDGVLNAFTYEYSGTDGTGGSYSAGTAIQSGQAFFVRAASGTGSLTLTESMKSSIVSPTFRNSNTAMASIFRVGFLKQTATDWMPLDGCIAGFYEGANAAADDADGKKMINTGENIGFVRNAVNLSSEHYPLVTAQDILYLKVWNTQQAHYKLKLNTEEFTMAGVEAYLQDLYTGTSQSLNLDGSVQDYEFDVDPTVSASSGNRFRIVFTNTALAVTHPEQGQLSIYPNPATGGKVTVSLPTGNFEGCSYELINVLGQVVRQDEIANANSSQVIIPLTGLPNSWYALRIRKDNKIMYQGKLIINN